MTRVSWVIGLLVLLAASSANGESAADQATSGGVFLPRLGAQVELPAGWTYVESGEMFDALTREDGASAVLFAVQEPEESCASFYDEEETDVALEVGHGFVPRVRKEVDEGEAVVGFCRPLPDGHLLIVVTEAAPGTELATEVASARVQRALELGAAVAAQLERTPGWRVPKSVLELSGPKLTLQLPASPTRWELDAAYPDWILRVRPEAPSLRFTVAILENEPADQCDRFVRAAMEQVSGSVRQAPQAVPSGWHPLVGQAGQTMVVCGQQTDLVVVTIRYEGDFDSSDLKDLGPLINRIGMLAEEKAVERRRQAEKHAFHRGSEASAPEVSSQPAAAPEREFSLGEIDLHFFGGARRTGLKAADGVFGGVVGSSGWLMDDSDDISFAGHYDAWLGYTPRDDAAAEGAIKIGGGPTVEDRFALVALAGIGYSHLGDEPLPSGIVGLLEVRGRLQLDAVAFEAAIGRSYTTELDWRSNNFELRLYFALGEESTWTAAWRHANCPGLTQDFFMLGRGFDL